MCIKLKQNKPRSNKREQIKSFKLALSFQANGEIDQYHLQANRFSIAIYRLAKRVRIVSDRTSEYKTR